MSPATSVCRQSHSAKHRDCWKTRHTILLGTVPWGTTAGTDKDLLAGDADITGVMRRTDGHNVAPVRMLMVLTAYHGSISTLNMR